MYYFYCHFCNEVIKYWKANPSQRELRRYHNDLLEDYDKPNPKKYRCRRREKVLIERRKALLANDTISLFIFLGMGTDLLISLYNLNF